MAVPDTQNPSTSPARLPIAQQLDAAGAFGGEEDAAQSITEREDKQADSAREHDRSASPIRLRMQTIGGRLKSILVKEEEEIDAGYAKRARVVPAEEEQHETMQKEDIVKRSRFRRRALWEETRIKCEEAQAAQEEEQEGEEEKEVEEKKAQREEENERDTFAPEEAPRHSATPQSRGLPTLAQLAMDTVVYRIAEVGAYGYLDRLRSEYANAVPLLAFILKQSRD